MLKALSVDIARQIAGLAEQYNAADRRLNEKYGMGPVIDVGDLNNAEWMEEASNLPERAALRDAIRAMSEDQICELTALMWIGRGDGGDDWRPALRHANNTYNKGSVDYIADKSPMLPKYIADGLEKLGLN